MNGAIFGAEVDLTHPLAYGYNQKTVSLFKANRVFMEKSKNPYATPFYYGSKPLQSGWVSRENRCNKKFCSSYCKYSWKWKSDQYCRQSKFPGILAGWKQTIYECNFLWKNN